MNDTTNNNIKKDGYNMNNVIEIKINETLTVKINPFPTIEEKIAFVKTVVDGAYIDNDIYYSLVDANFIVLFLTAFSDYKFPSELKNEDGTIDIDSAYNSICHLDWYKLKKNLSIGALIKNLTIDIDKQIEFRNQKIVAIHSRSIILEETFDNINMLVNMGMNFLTDTIGKFSDINPETLNDIVKNIPENLISIADTK